MKILLLGDVSGPFDEGMKNTTHYLKRELSCFHKVLTVSPRQIIFPKLLYKIWAFAPNIIHYIHGPTWRSFAIVRLLKLSMPKAAIVMSALRPKIGPSNINWLLGYRPDLLLVQSIRHQQIYTNLGFRTHFFPAGVDIQRFVPVTDKQKKVLRKKHHLPAESYIVLHVGQISKVRELDKLLPVQATGEFQVIIVGATTIPADEQIANNLKKAGCIIKIDYIEQIEEFYQLADCFVFPGNGLSSAVEIPLSVLEAMACNLPIISGRFGGLPDIFCEHDDFIYANSVEQIVSKIKILKTQNPDISTRTQVMKFSWEVLARDLVDIYCSLVKQNNLHSKKRIKNKNSEDQSKLPRFICIIGIDGSGKTTLAKGIVNRAKQDGIKYLYVWGNAQPILMRPLRWLARRILLRGKDMFRDYQNYKASKEAIVRDNKLISKFYRLLLMFDYYLWLITRVQLPLLMGRKIICDRYVYDVAINLALVIGGNVEDAERYVEKLLRIFPKPDLLIYLDVPDEIALSRKTDIPSIKYLQERRQIYKKLLISYRFNSLDGTESIESLTKTSWNIINNGNKKYTYNYE